MEDLANKLPGASTTIEVTNSTGAQQKYQAFPAVPNSTFDALIMDAKLRQSLVTVRSLGSRGMRVAALEINSNTEPLSRIATFSSRWCKKHFVAPTYEQITQ